MSGDTRRLLLEIGVEEMPAAAARSGLRQLEDEGAQSLVENRLLTEEAAMNAVRVLGTPRRLTLIVEELPDAQRSEVIEMKGPPTKIAFDGDGKPAPAAVGFAKAQDVEVDTLEVREAEGGEYLFAVKKSPGRPAVEVLPGILRALVESLEFTKAMRWGVGTFRFIRPVRWLVALYGAEHISFEVDGLRSGCLTYGHRFLAEGPFELTDAAQYEETMSAALVAVDHKERRDAVEGLVKEAAAAAGGRAFADPTDIKVLDEVTLLVENPHVVVGDFDEGFLKVPRAALVMAMKSHQRYFPMEDGAGRLMARFAVVHNGDPAAAERIRRGHERVLRARLADAAFFFEEDTKTTLESKVDNLKSVVWQSKLGTIYEKTLRVRSLATRLAELIGEGAETRSLVERAALLAKADLTTSMVIEFTDLQGTIGSEYARVDGEPEPVVEALAEHYRPRFAGDELPSKTVSQVVAVADKLDTLAGCFLIGLIPTGSADPYGLRRQAAGIVQILARTGWSFAILDLVKLAIDNYREDAVEGGEPDKAAGELHDFMIARVRRRLDDAGASQAAVEAVLSAGHDVVAFIAERVSLLDAFEGKKELEDIKLAFTRCRNLSRPELGSEVDTALFDDPAEERLLGAAQGAREELKKELEMGGLDAAMMVLASMRPPIDEFFEAVMVMAKEETVKNNRLRLLNMCVGLSDEIADFSKLP